MKFTYHHQRYKVSWFHSLLKYQSHQHVQNSCLVISLLGTYSLEKITKGVWGRIKLFAIAEFAKLKNWKQLCPLWGLVNEIMALQQNGILCIHQGPKSNRKMSSITLAIKAEYKMASTAM